MSGGSFLKSEKIRSYSGRHFRVCDVRTVVEDADKENLILICAVISNNRSFPPFFLFFVLLTHLNCHKLHALACENHAGLNLKATPICVI